MSNLKIINEVVKVVSRELEGEFGKYIADENGVTREDITFKDLAAVEIYRMALAKKEIELRGRGNNYPANLVYDIARGQEAELRYKRDIADIEYEICKDRLRNERSNIEAIRSLIAWDRANYLNS